MALGRGDQEVLLASSGSRRYHVNSRSDEPNFQPDLNENPTLRRRTLPLGR